MHKHDVTYQLDDPQYVLMVSEEGLKVYRKDRLLFELDETKFAKLIEEYEEINR